MKVQNARRRDPGLTKAGIGTRAQRLQERRNRPKTSWVTGLPQGLLALSVSARFQVCVFQIYLLFLKSNRSVDLLDVLAILCGQFWQPMSYTSRFVAVRDRKVGADRPIVSSGTIGVQGIQSTESSPFQRFATPAAVAELVRAALLECLSEFIVCLPS